MYIQNSSFLQPTYKNIRPYECSMVVVEGPNTVGKLSMQGLEIPYDSYFVSKMTMASGATNKAVLYGFLGNDVTYIMIKVNYDDGAKIRCATLEKKEFYIEYYFADNPSDVRPIGQLMILTGGSNHRIPQIFLNNPMDFPLTVEIMVASADVATTTDNGITSAVIDGLYYNSVITDIFVSGSTQFEIINEKDEILLVLPIEYFLLDENIQNIYQDSNTLIVTTENNDKVILKFLTVYDACQAHSRFNWIFEDPTNRYLTKDSPEPDLAPPIIHMNVYAGDTFNVSGITKDELRIYYITGVTDARDGDININDVEVIIRKYGTLTNLPAVVEEGVYDVIFRVNDIAANETTVLRVATFDMTPPVITFKSAAMGATIPMSILNDSQLIPSQGLTESDVIRFCIDKVTDNIDGDIAKSAVTMLLTGATFPISIGGSIPITFSVSDRSENVCLVTGKTLIVTDDIPPILTDGFMFTTPSTGLTGDFIHGYTFPMIGDSGLTYALQFVSGVTKDKDLDVTMYPFYIITSTVSGGTLWDYFNTYDSGTTKDYLLEVANGNNPLFYVMKSGVTGEFMYDGASYNLSSTFVDLQMRGDYPEGTYYINGDIVDIHGNTNTISYTMEITR